MRANRLHCFGRASTTRLRGFSVRLLVVSTLLTFGPTLNASAFYNPNTGRWLSRDPIKERGGLSLYGVGRNDVVNQVDAFGLDVGTVKIVNSEAYVEDSGWRTHLRGWFLTLRWFPPKSWNQPWDRSTGCRPCLKAIWVQDFSRTIFGINNGSNTDWDESDYKGFSSEWIANVNSYAETSDQPMNGGTMVSLWLQAVVKFRAQSMVKCIQGPDAGMIYKTVEWGYDWTYDSTPTLYGPNISIGPIADN